LNQQDYDHMLRRYEEKPEIKEEANVPQ
jgi:hypothetical protein